MPLPYTIQNIMDFALESNSRHIHLAPGQRPIHYDADGRPVYGFLSSLNEASVIMLADDLRMISDATPDESKTGISTYSVVHKNATFNVKYVWTLKRLTVDIAVLPPITAQELCGKHLGWTFRSVAYPNKNKTCKPYRTEREWEASTIYHLANGSVMIGGGHLYLHPDTVLTVLSDGSETKDSE